MNEQKSGKYSLNSSDWKKSGKAALVWSAPVLLIYVSAVLGVLQLPSHNFNWNDLVPSTFTTGGIVTYLFMQVQGLLIRFTQGK